MQSNSSLEYKTSMMQSSLLNQEKPFLLPPDFQPSKWDITIPCGWVKSKEHCKFVHKEKRNANHRSKQDLTLSLSPSLCILQPAMPDSSKCASNRWKTTRNALPRWSDPLSFIGSSLLSWREVPHKQAL